MGRIWLPRISRYEMEELDRWWAAYNERRMASPNWPPKWKPSKRKKRWRKK